MRLGGIEEEARGDEEKEVKMRLRGIEEEARRE